MTREPTKAEAETFNARAYAGTPANKARACFGRHSDAEHLAGHPRQKVAFRLDRTDNSECASLVTDRKELAALRHK